MALRRKKASRSERANSAIVHRDLTFAPVSKAPRRERRGLAPGLFKYERVSLRTYR
jgi:hypothetical protein